MAEVEIESGVYENTVGLVERFLEIALSDPLSAVLLLTGAALVAVSVTAFGLLSVGGVLAWLSAALPSPGAPGPEA